MSVYITQRVRCPVCSGTKISLRQPDKPCEKCGGTGELLRRVKTTK